MSKWIGAYVQRTLSPCLAMLIRNGLACLLLSTREQKAARGLIEGPLNHTHSLFTVIGTTRYRQFGMVGFRSISLYKYDSTSRGFISHSRHIINNNEFNHPQRQRHRSLFPFAFNLCSTVSIRFRIYFFLSNNFNIKTSPPPLLSSQLNSPSQSTTANLQYSAI